MCSNPVFRETRATLKSVRLLQDGVFVGKVSGGRDRVAVNTSAQNRPFSAYLEIH